MISIGVTAVGGGVGQAVLQSLSYSHMQWRTTGMDTRLLAPGLYWCAGSYLVPPVVQEEAYVQRLVEVIRKEQLDMLIPGLDVELEPLARHRDVFATEGCTPIVASHDAVRLSHDKLAFFQFCEQRGLPFVHTYSVEGALEAMASLTFPVIVKPRRGRASLGVRLVHDRAQLEALPRVDHLIVQRYLPPPGAEPQRNGKHQSLNQSDEWSIQFFVDGDGEILGHYISRNELKVGIPLEIIPEENDEVLAAARQLVEALIEEGLQGPVNIQGRETDDGVRFFEVNTRFTGITAVRASMGYREVDAAALALMLGRKDDARASLAFRTDFRSTRHVEHTTVPVTRVEEVRGGSSKSDPQNGEPDRRTPGKVLVTGASGYIGANLVQHLTATYGCSLIASVSEADGVEFDRAGSRIDVAEAVLPETLCNLEGVDTVVHLAAARPGDVADGDVNRFLEVNVEGTRRLLAQAMQAGVRRFVFASSQAVYGTSRHGPWSEMLVPRPDSSYGMSKWIAEQVCQSMSSSELQVVALRMARVYGHGLHTPWDTFPHVFARQVREQATLDVYGDGEMSVDLVHIRDVCRAIENACLVPLPAQGYSVFNLGGGSPVTVHQLARVYQSAAETMGIGRPEIMHRGEPAQSVHFGMDVRRAAAHLDWSPQVSLETGVQELLCADEHANAR